MNIHILDRWLTSQKSPVGKHILLLLTEISGARAKLLQELQAMVRHHYVDPTLAAKRLASLGAPKTAELLREHLPTKKKARSGDIGEILATEIAEHHLNYDVPIRRLRWKDGRNMALRGDDLIGLMRDAHAKLQFLKGESKSRASLATKTLDDAGKALDHDRGRPTRHSVLFVAERLREQGHDDIANELEEATLQSFKGSRVDHLLFALAGSDPQNLLAAHLTDCATKKRRRHVVGMHIKDHEKFIDDLFSGL